MLCGEALPPVPEKVGYTFFYEVCGGVLDLYPCSNIIRIPNVLTTKHYTAEDNGLLLPWMGRIFLHPPFGYNVEQWFSKLYLERLESRTTEAIVLWKSSTETAAWKTLSQLSCLGCFPFAWIRFNGPGSDMRRRPTFSPALFYVGDRPARFEDAFRQIGDIRVVPKVVSGSPERGPA